MPCRKENRRCRPTAPQKSTPQEQGLAPRPAAAAASTAPRRRGTGRRTSRLVAQKVDAVELVAKTPARFDRGLELGFVEHIGLDIVVRDDRPVTRLAGEQRGRAKEIARAKLCDR